jgi:fatty acid-binding protein DegV
VEAEMEASKLAAELKTSLSISQEIPVYELPPAIVVHSGPRALGVGFFV